MKLVISPWSSLVWIRLHLHLAFVCHQICAFTCVGCYRNNLLKIFNRSCIVTGISKRAKRRKNCEGKTVVNFGRYDVIDFNAFIVVQFSAKMATDHYICK